MYSEAAGSRKTLGDVDVLYHEGLYHLFHLVLPNHDFIAHAVSKDGLNWQRVDNALFIGNPGSWDDSMLWTMHVSPDPHTLKHWRMFYTGLSRRDRGLKQRIGMATSANLYQWKKASVKWRDHRTSEESIVESDALKDTSFNKSSCFPLSPDPEFYESSIDEGRHWVSWRDPFYYRQDDKGWLLAAGRVKHGPIVRRGCVAVMEETSPSHFTARAALHFPGLYDDIEVPNLIRLDNEYFLIGSIREDAKIRYWHTCDINKPWRSYYDNVLLPGGNYAGRICHDEHGILIWNFYTQNSDDRTTHNLMLPPKRLIRTPSGLIRVQTFEALLNLPSKPGDSSRLISLNCSSQEGSCSLDQVCNKKNGTLRISSDSGFEAFVFPETFEAFMLACNMKLTGLGKCGFVFRLDEESHDGYYLSLDMLKGLAQLRSWGTGPAGSGEHMMQFQALQAGNWHTDNASEVDVRLLAYGSYFELSIDNRVVLSLADQKFVSGRLGFYSESSKIDISNVELLHWSNPRQSDEHLSEG